MYIKQVCLGIKVKEVNEGGKRSWVGGSGTWRRDESPGLTVLANTFEEKLREQSHIQTFPKERVSQPCTAVSC